MQNGGKCGDLCTFTVMNLLCRPYAHLFNSPAPWTKCSIVLTEMSSRLPGFIKCWPRCLNLNVAKAVQSQRTWEAISDACLRLSHSGLSTSPILNGWPFKCWCPGSNPVSILSWLLFKLRNSPAFLSGGLLRRPLACVCLWRDCQYSSCFLLIQPLITPLVTFADMPRAGSGLVSGCVEPCLATGWIHMCPSTWHHVRS
jgi:hypothetical protein